ncbi:MAG: hypothetical protein DMG99_12355 [Acidobacteria bacterium]|nr:MAG: hypothetical protein DMG99_12355 [Acidobacteriota bacterium]
MEAGMQSSIPLTTSTGVVGKPAKRRIVPLSLAALLFVFLICPLLQSQQAAGSEASDKDTIRALLNRVDQLEARVAQLEAKAQIVSPAAPMAQAPSSRAC